MGHLIIKKKLDFNLFVLDKQFSIDRRTNTGVCWSSLNWILNSCEEQVTLVVVRYRPPPVYLFLWMSVMFTFCKFKILFDYVKVVEDIIVKRKTGHISVIRGRCKLHVYGSRKFIAENNWNSTLYKLADGGCIYCIGSTCF